MRLEYLLFRACVCLAVVSFLLIFKILSSFNIVDVAMENIANGK